MNKKILGLLFGATLFSDSCLLHAMEKTTIKTEKKSLIKDICKIIIEKIAYDKNTEEKSLIKDICKIIKEKIAYDKNTEEKSIIKNICKKIIEKIETVKKELDFRSFSIAYDKNFDMFIVATAHANGDISLWTIDTTNPDDIKLILMATKVFTKQKDSIKSVFFHENGRVLLAKTNNNNTLILYELAGFQLENWFSV